jgi:class 3 adenylate cyclase
MAREYHYDWQVDLQSTPEALWPFVADTNRFNHDTGLPKIEQVTTAPDLQPGKYRLQFFILGQKVEWDEEPFEWVYPARFGVLRDYRGGPLRQMRVLVEMTERPQGGTHLRYRVWAQPTNLLGDLAIQVGIGKLSARQFIGTFQRYDAIALNGGTQFDLADPRARFAVGGEQRLAAAQPALAASDPDGSVSARLEKLLQHADDLALQRIRPYPLADHWKLPRRRVLETFLRASRAGILDLRWELLCPMCRGVGESHQSLGEIHNGAHCDFCNLDFDIDFDRQVEVIFRPTAAIRSVPESLKFCLTGPQSEPHMPLNTLLSAGDELVAQPVLETGYYTISASGIEGGRTVFVDSNGTGEATLTALPGGWDQTTLFLSPEPTLRVINQTGFPQRIYLERQAWRDDAATAADVTTLQLFRDLFSREALRAGEEIAIRNVTLMFTDLRDSTRMYRQIGDAPAFGRVRQHFDALEQAIAAEGGAVVKTMGDAVMAVFRQPVGALRAIHAAHHVMTLAEGTPPLYLKVGLHQGPCIAVTLNERLDYFGSTVNAAARLPGLAEGGEIIFSGEIKADPEVETWLNENRQTPQGFQSAIKGFDEPFDLWKMRL